MLIILWIAGGIIGGWCNRIFFRHRIVFLLGHKADSRTTSGVCREWAHATRYSRYAAELYKPYELCTRD